MNRRSVLKSIAAACTASAAALGVDGDSQEAERLEVESAAVVEVPAAESGTRTILVLSVSERLTDHATERLGEMLRSFVFENGLDVVPVVVPGHMSLSLMTVPAVPPDVAARRMALRLTEAMAKREEILADIKSAFIPKKSC